MDDRTHILDALRKNKPPAVDTPSLSALKRSTTPDRLEQFRKIVEQIGGAVMEIDREELKVAIRDRFPEAEQTASTVSAFTGTVKLTETIDPRALDKLDVFVCEGVIGVAENGAIWVPERHMVHRVAPFITQHLVIVLDRRRIVSDMHEAYEQIDVSKEGFGVFIAGPSKTADIEQSLVLGAHGPRSMTVALL